jgi:hypothetical protein
MEKQTINTRKFTNGTPEVYYKILGLASKIVKIFKCYYYVKHGSPLAIKKNISEFCIFEIASKLQEILENNQHEKLHKIDIFLMVYYLHLDYLHPDKKFKNYDKTNIKNIYTKARSSLIETWKFTSVYRGCPGTLCFRAETKSSILKSVVKP